MTINLGDKVRDRLTGFSGIAVARYEFLYGCTRWAIQPEKLGKDSKVIDSQTFDEPQIEVIKSAGFKVHATPPQSAQKPGGPQREPQPRSTPLR